MTDSEMHFSQLHKKNFHLQLYFYGTKKDSKKKAFNVDELRKYFWMDE